MPATDTPEPGQLDSARRRRRRATRGRTPRRLRSRVVAAAPTRLRSGFIWPASGPISSYFGPSHPLGIDIDFFANPNQAVGAAAAGTVTFAGGDACCSYGYYVIIDHGNGFETLYGHFSSSRSRPARR